MDAYESRREFWCEHIIACDASGLSSKAYAEQHGLKVQSLYAARKRERTRDGAARAELQTAMPFARVRSTPGDAPLRCRVRLPNGAVVEMDTEADAVPALLRCVASLR